MEPLLRPFVALSPPRWVPEVIIRRLESWGFFKRPEIIFQASPQREQDIEFDNLILIGSQAYNVVTGYYITRGTPYLTLEFDTTDPGVVIRRGRNTGERIPFGQDDLAVLLRIRDAEHGTTVFIGAGMGVNGTRGAIEYLMNNWEELRRVYGDQEFGLCLRFPSIIQDQKGFRRPDVLRQFPH
jgi:hypothetical protein